MERFVGKLFAAPSGWVGGNTSKTLKLGRQIFKRASITRRVESHQPKLERYQRLTCRAIGNPEIQQQTEDSRLQGVNRVPSSTLAEKVCFTSGYSILLFWVCCRLARAGRKKVHSTPVCRNRCDRRSLRTLRCPWPSNPRQYEQSEPKMCRDATGYPGIGPRTRATGSGDACTFKSR